MINSMYHLGRSRCTHARGTQETSRAEPELTLEIQKDAEDHKSKLNSIQE